MRKSRVFLSRLPLVLMLLLVGCGGAGPSALSGGGSAYSGTLTYAAFGSDGYTHVYTVTAGAPSTQLTTGPQNDETPEWSPDGARIVFQRSDGNGIGVFVTNADGTGLSRLSPIPGSDILPAFSADGTKIVFSTVVSQASCNGGSFPTTSILTMSATDGSERAVIVDGTTANTCFNVEPREAPNGTAIVFMCGPANLNIQACTVAPDGSDWRYLTNSTTTVGDPHWSWDSQKLAISHRDASGNVNVWTLNADGSELAQITSFVEPEEGGDAGWSLDDKQLIFEHDTGGEGQSVANAPAELYLVNIAGGNAVALSIPCSDIGCAPRFKP